MTEIILVLIAVIVFCWCSYQQGRANAYLQIRLDGLEKSQAAHVDRLIEIAKKVDIEPSNPEQMYQWMQMRHNIQLQNELQKMWRSPEDEEN